MSQAIEIEEIAYHRNGIAGKGFHVVTFTMTVGRETAKMVGVVFDVPGECAVAVFDRDLLGQGVIAFTENSWRGDVYSAQLTQAIAAWKEDRR